MRLEARKTAITVGKLSSKVRGVWAGSDHRSCIP